MQVITKRQSMLIDLRATAKLGISTLVMMEDAGIRVADFILQILKKKKNQEVAIFCGKGNNAGDGLVVSRQLICEKLKVDTFLLAPSATLSQPARMNLNILKKMSENIFRIRTAKDLKRINFSRYGLLVDAIFGIGLKGKVKGIFNSAIQKINSSNIPIVSIDIPSGLDADKGYPQPIAIKADYTVTLIAPKKGMLINHGPWFCGNIIAKHIGFSSSKGKF